MNAGSELYYIMCICVFLSFVLCCQWLLQVAVNKDYYYIGKDDMDPRTIECQLHYIPQAVRNVMKLELDRPCLHGPNSSVLSVFIYSL